MPRLFWVGLIWFVGSVPAGMAIGRVLRRLSEQTTERCGATLVEPLEFGAHRCRYGEGHGLTHVCHCGQVWRQEPASAPGSAHQGARVPIARPGALQRPLGAPGRYWG